MSDCWAAEADSPFGVHNLPYGAAMLPGDSEASLVVRIGDRALDLAAACAALQPALVPLVTGPVLNPLLGAGAPAWAQLRSALQGWLGDASLRPVLEPLLHPLDELQPTLPVEVADYVDFYASEHHATNVGRLFRPDGEALPPAWKHLPIGYHGRAGTVVVSGTDVVRPSGQRAGAGGAPEFGPSQALDVEVEVGFVLGGPTTLGEPVPLAQAASHVFGVCLLNDWSARDIQQFETRPLGPFLGKSFATSVSAWVVPLAALEPARVAAPPRDVAVVPHLDDTGLPWGLDIDLALEINGGTVSRPPFAAMYWTLPQLVAHLTSNGASIRAGDLIASGTVSGASPDQLGCLLELTRNGAQPLRLADGSERCFLADGDEVVIRGEVPAAPWRAPIGLGEVRGRVLPAR